MGETLTAIISAEYQTAALVAGTIATPSPNLLYKRSPRVGVIIFGLLIGPYQAVHGRIIGSMSTAIMPFSGYMLIRPRRDVTVDGRAFMADLQMLAKYRSTG